MAIRMRRGNLADFDPTKQLSGEFGVSIDNSAGNQKVFMAFGNGNVKELMTVEDAEAQIGELVDDAVDAAIGDIVDTVTEAAETATTAAQTATTQAGTATTKAGEAASSASSASTDATSAAGSAASADDSAEDSEAWAVGQRDGQDVPTTDETYHNNAKYWAEQASQAAGGGVTSFNGRSGSVSPQSGDYTAAMVGLGNVDNTSDLNKPISTATQTALNGKADTSSLTDGSVTKVGTSTVGSTTQPIYLNAGVPTEISAVDVIAEAPRVKSSTELDALCALVVADHKTRFFRIQGVTGMDSTLSDLITYKNIVYTYGWGIISDTYSGGSSNFDLVITYFAGPSYPDNSQSRIFIWKQSTSGTFRQNNVLITNKDTDIQTGTPTSIHANLNMNGSYTFVHKSGNVVDFRLLATVTTAGTIGTYTKLFVLPYTPKKQVWGAVDYGNLGGYSHANYYTNGKDVYLASPMALTVGQEVTVRGTYFTED